MSNDLLQKVVDTTAIGAGTGGILNPTQSNKFLDYIWDATSLGSDVRKVRMRAPTVELDKIAVGERIARVATEGASTGMQNADATFTKISLTSKKIRLDWELTTEALEDNLERESLEDTIARLMATQLGNDLEDLAINGDDTSVDNLLKAFDGWRQIVLGGGNTPGRSDGAAVVDANGDTLGNPVFNKAVKAVERKYLQRRNQLRYYVGSSMLQDYMNSLTSRATALGDEVIFGNPRSEEGSGGLTAVRPFGIPVFEVPLYEVDRAGDYSGAAGNHGELDLTMPNNRIWGILRDVTVYREFQPKKDAIEYTVYTRTGVEIENLDNWVHVKNIKIAA